MGSQCNSHRSGELQKERGARAPVPRPPYRGGTVNAVRWAQIKTTTAATLSRLINTFLCSRSLGEIWQIAKEVGIRRGHQTPAMILWIAYGVYSFW